MPFPLIPAIVGGAGLLGQGINAWATRRNNQRSQNWDWKMYQQQRTDALSDWNMANAYNSPKAQMQRFKEAGLNPNLIYGQMSEASPIRSSNTGNWNPQAPQFDLGGLASQSMDAYYDSQIKPLQVDNLAKAVEMASEQIRLTQAQTAATLAGAASTEQGIKKSKFDLALAESLRPLTMERAEHETRQARLSADYTANQDARAAMQNSATLKQMAATLLEIKARTAKTEQEKAVIELQKTSILQSQELNELDLRLKRKGIQPGDNMFLRIGAQLWDELKQGAKIDGSWFNKIF